MIRKGIDQKMGGPSQASLAANPVYGFSQQILAMFFSQQILAMVFGSKF
jgi:hypothetical protein